MASSLVPFDTPESPIEIPRPFFEAAKASSIKADCLKAVIQYCIYHDEHPIPVDGERRLDDVIPWDEQFCIEHKALLGDLLVAAAHLDIESLRRLMRMVLGALLKNVSGADVKQACAAYSGYVYTE